MSQSGAAKFFCENCGAEVNRNADRCPSCGRIFASVRCPACGFTGEEERFKKGCPVCGYCAAPGNESEGRGSQPAGKLNTGGKAVGKLPLWVYVLAALSLAVAAALVFMR
jgi:predicted RNA-binding Zn-ribbon protein involved in translation (DUF1610 family)